LYSAPLIENSDIAYIALKLKIDANSIHRAYDDFEEQDIISNSDGSFILNVEMPNDNSLCIYLLSYGAALVVLEPTSLRTCLAEESRNITLKYYKEDYHV